MQLELKVIKGGSLEQEYICSVADFPDLFEISAADGPCFDESLKFHLRFQQTGKFVEVDGHLETVVKLKCGRCLHGFEQPLSESFALTFIPLAKDSETEEEVELNADELGLLTYVDDTLELQGALQEQLLMATPISPICKTSCLGLCPECGVNLNVIDCNCFRKPFNSKFNVLADMVHKKT